MWKDVGQLRIRSRLESTKVRLRTLFNVATEGSDDTLILSLVNRKFTNFCNLIESERCLVIKFVIKFKISCLIIILLVRVIYSCDKFRYGARQSYDASFPKFSAEIIVRGASRELLSDTLIELYDITAAR